MYYITEYVIVKKKPLDFETKDQGKNKRLASLAMNWSSCVKEEIKERGSRQCNPTC